MALLHLFSKFMFEGSYSIPFPQANVYETGSGFLFSSLLFSFLWCCFHGFVSGVVSEGFCSIPSLGEPLRDWLRFLSTCLFFPSAFEYSLLGATWVPLMLRSLSLDSNFLEMDSLFRQICTSVLEPPVNLRNALCLFTHLFLIKKAVQTQKDVTKKGPQRTSPA